MVNLRSEGMPDLTKEYMPSRWRNEKTPEQQMQDHRSLSMSITNQKTASETFESDNMIVKEQSDKFNNKYKDLVKDISEMSDNAENSSD
ncbi:hypothetical protein BDFG_05741 [Blastomyces dermatitidis ATCC 26199]|nr:hypothetical protein BDFG_05741 [Blastomyces dermatitidis ATCC 26199]